MMIQFSFLPTLKKISTKNPTPDINKKAIQIFLLHITLL